MPNPSIIDALFGGPSWMDRAKQQAQQDIANYLQGGFKGLMSETQGTQDLAGGFGGTTYKAYHGMGAPIIGEKLIAGHPYRYDPGFMGAQGIYSTNRPHLANDYAMLKAAKELDPAPNVMPLNLEMNNPLTITGAEKKRLSGLPQHERDQWLQDVYAKGHDGVIVQYGEGDPNLRSSGYQEYLAPAEQYKSWFQK